ncbi:hypothetical protein B0H13DRAFT_2318384 [Mycena leptocephala]|nr:hypothetical protein B0H13DRAFT_2318384 [Mycena leptocephala]
MASSATSLPVTSAPADLPDAAIDYTPNNAPTILDDPADFTSANLTFSAFPIHENLDTFNVPENFDEMLASMGIPELNSNSDAEYSSTDAVQAPRPAPRPIHAGAAFMKDRAVGGSPGRVPQRNTVEVNGFNFPTSASDLRPSVLFQAFTKNPTLTSQPASLASAALRPGSSSSSPFAFTSSSSLNVPSESPTPVASLNATISSVVNATTAPPSAAASTLPPTTPPSLSTTTSTTAPATRPTFSFSNGRTGPQRPSALSVFSSVVADATATPLATMPVMSVAPVAPTPPPQYIQSCPMGNPPKPTPVAPVARKPAKKPAKNTGTGRPRGRLRKNPSPNEIATPPPTTADDEHATLLPAEPLLAALTAATDAVVPAPALLTGAAARAEAARQRRQDAELRTSRVQALEREKEMVDDTAAKRAADAAEAKRVHNPAGGADLFITGSRPKRAIMATKNPDGSDIIRQVKRTRDQLAAIAQAEDQRMLDGFARQKGKAVGPAGQKRKAAAPAAEIAAKKRKTPAPAAETVAKKRKAAAAAPGATTTKKTRPLFSCPGSASLNAQLLHAFFNKSSIYQANLL